MLPPPQLPPPVRVELPIQSEPAPPRPIQLVALNYPAPLPDFPSVSPAIVANQPVVNPLPGSAGPLLSMRLPDEPTQCIAQASTATTASAQVADFGPALVAAALAQIDSVSFYQARYVRIGYPGGDVSPFFGVCTDVVIRAYRALGVDLQVEVQKARVGRGDTNIDHRRTETLRRFFALSGEVLPVSEFAEDYQAGDIVTYYRPQNRSSTAHIAIVSDIIAPSGRPMIIHNRGFGVQLEDALFVDMITGHYRYHGKVEPVAMLSSKPSPPGTSARLVARANQTFAQRAGSSLARSMPQ